ncbi:MAG: dihydroorotase, partial [Syntrophomonadaceae bacterium]|nr:dihydroorotase [Syntrophomonadaceae bacterium]
MRLLIKNGRVIDPANNLDTITDILIAEGKIIEIKPELEDEQAEIIDATNKIVCPGFIDIHVHL